VVLLHVVSVQLLQYKPRVADPDPCYSENLDPDPHYRSFEVGTWLFSMNSAYSFYNTNQQCSRSMTFWGGSGSGSAF
jgi:hypothetical protein